MFGFLTGPPNTREYRQAYARCCSMQRTLFGYRSLAFVSYEAVFLYCAAVDLQMIPAPRAEDPTCCRTRGRKLHDWTEQEEEAAKFASNFALLLAKTKLQDDIRDSRSVLAYATRLLLRRQTHRMDEYFRLRDSKFEVELDDCFQEHAKLENTSRHHPIEEYVQPTANAFSLLFQLFARQHNATSHEALFSQLGHCVGAALIAFDCAVDWKRDRARGHYNPLRNAAQVDDTLNFAIRRLVEAGWILGDATEDQGTAGSVLRHRIASIARRRRKVSADQVDPQKATHRRHGIFQLKAGFCDCDCPCPADGCDFGGCCNPCDACDACDASCYCCDACCPDNKKGKNQPGARNAAKDSFYTDMIGAAGEAKTQLAPYGTVMVGGEEHAAKAQHGMIEQGQRVVVMGKDTFGLVVQIEKPKT